MFERTRHQIVDDCFDTVIAIAASKYCSEFIIGYTHGPARVRQYQYFNAVELGYQHLVVLCDRLSQADALWIEGRLQSDVKQGNNFPEESNKYNAKRRLTPHTRSSGGVTLAPDARWCSVYMAWRE